MKKTKLLTGLFAVALLGGSLAACGGDGSYTVKMGLQNNMGGACGHAAVVEGFFEDYEVNVDHEILGGPQIAQNLIQGSLDVGFLGNGVAWNYFTKDSKIKIFAIDNITDDDRLLANPNSEKAKGLEEAVANVKMDNYEELGDALAGSTIAFDGTTTPATFFSSLVTEINSKLDDADRIWWTDNTGKKLPATGITAYSEDRKINVDNSVTNANLPSMMGGNKYDFCVAFSPSAWTIQNNNKFKVVARASTHLSTDNVVPSTWAYNVDFAENHPDEFAAFLKGLVKGMDFRHNNKDKTAADIAELMAGTITKESIDTDTGYWPTAQDQLDYTKTDGIAYTYVENIYNNHKSGANADKVVKAAKDVADFSYLRTACEAVLAE